MTRPKLPAEIVRLGWISFCLDVASEMIYPLIPLFVAGVLGAPGMALGLIEGAADGVLSVLTALSGRQSDRLRRRTPYIRAGYSLSAAAKPLIALVSAWPGLLALRVADRTGKGLRTAARDALIADLAPAAQRGAAFGFHRAMDTSGAVVGVLLTLALLHFLPGQYRTIFALTVIPGAAAVWLTFRIPEPVHAPAPSSVKARFSDLPRAFWRTCIPLWIFAVGASSDAFLLLRAHDVGFTETQVILAYALMNVAYALVAQPAGRLSDKFGRPRMLAIGWCMHAVVYASFAWLSLDALWFVFAAYGVFLGLTQGVAKAWIADHAPAHLRGTAIGAYQLALGLLVLMSNVLAGWLWDNVSHSATFGFSALTSVAALAFLPRTARAS